MRMFYAHSSSRGQTAMEYLLLLAVVAVVVIACFRKGALVDQVHDSAQNYYGSVTQVIMGTGNEIANGEQIVPINGGWCPVQCPPSGTGATVVYATCACPQPAFGGKYCSGQGGVVQCK